MKKPGSKGEHNLQKEFKTEKRASAFYNTQLLHHLNPEMCRFILEQEMVFISTADANGECVPHSAQAMPVSWKFWTKKPLSFPNIGATEFWPAWETSPKTRI